MPNQLRVLIAVGALSAATLVTLAQSQIGVRGISFDFIARYAAGELAAHGDSPYDNEMLYAQERAHDTPRVVPMYDAPPVAAAFRLLTVLPLRLACFVVGVLNLVACVVLARVLTRGSPHRVWAIATVALLVFSPARHTLHLGQTDLIALVLVVLFARSQPVLAVAKPQTTGLTAIALFVERRSRDQLGRALLVAGGGAVVVLAVSALLAGSATWADWAGHLGERYGGAGEPMPLLLALAGGAILVGGVRRAGGPGAIDLVCLAGAATGLLAVMGGWNPQWFLAQALPLAALLLAVRSGSVSLRPYQSALLVLACACAAGDSYVVFKFSPRLWVPVAILACLVVGLVALRELRWQAGVAVVLLNAAVTALPLSTAERVAVPMLVSVILVHLVLELRIVRAGEPPVAPHELAVPPPA